MTLKKGRARIANRIIILVIALELISIAIWGSATYLSSRNELLNTIRSRLSEATLRMETEMRNFFLPIQIHASVVADQIYARSLPPGQIEPLLNQILRARPEVLELSFVSTDGRELQKISRFSTSVGTTRDFREDKLVVNALVGSLGFGTIRFSEYNEPIVPLAVPVGLVGDIRGVLLLTINLRLLWELIQDQKVGKSGYVYVADVHHSLIGHKDPSMVFAGFSLDNSSIPKDMFLYSADNSSRLGIYSNFQNVEVAGVSHFDAHQNWWIFVELPTAEGLAPLRRMVQKFVLVFAFAAVFTVSMVMVFSRLTLRPLDNFVMSMVRLANGERNVRFDVPDRSELAFLAQGFNNMAKALDERISDLIESESKLRASQEQYKSLNASLQERVDEATHELVDANRRLEQAAWDAHTANKAKSFFLANMSHELRTPLNAILGYSEYLVDEMGPNADPEWSDLLGKINTAGRHLLQLIDNILDLSKIEAGKVQLNLEVIVVSNLIKTIVDTIAPLAGKRNNLFIVTCPDDLGVLESDELRIRQVLINLLGNACKFTESGTITLAVSMFSLKGESWIRFDVTDSGIGLTHQQIDRLFQAFNQADTNTTRKYGGAGLGLAISRQLCKLMGGDITVQSIPDRGSTFSVILPQCARSPAPLTLSPPPESRRALSVEPQKTESVS